MDELEMEKEYNAVLNIARHKYGLIKTSHNKQFIMTVGEEEFHIKLKIARNKAKMLLKYYLNTVADALINNQNPILPITNRSGYLEYNKDPEKFEIYFDLMVEIYGNLMRGHVRTKRDMYYGNSSLFKKQSVLDSAIATLAKLMSVPRDALNVVGAAKGLYLGELVINDKLVHSTSVNLIPRREEITTIDLLNTRFVLVIEKDAVMNVIADNYDYLKYVVGPFLLVTGKGFPCLRTKQFMNLIESRYPNLPKYILVDNDPYGIDIVLNYISSSENEMDSCPSLEYIGVNHFDIDIFGNPSMTESLAPSDLRKLENIKRKAKSLNRFREVEEIIFMQNNLKKAEIEALYYPDCSSFCKRFLVRKLQGLLGSMEEEDIALKKRLLVDERVIRKLSKKNDDLGVDLEQLNIQFEKNLLLLKSFERDWTQVSSLIKQIEQNIEEEHSNIRNCKTDLIAAQTVLQNRLEYDQIAKEILTFQSRPELLQNISSVELEIAALINQIEAVDGRTEERYLDCSQILESIQSLLETVNSDVKEFK